MTKKSTTGESVAEWFAAHLPEGLFGETPEVVVDREEITVVGPLPADAEAGEAASVDDVVAAYREDTRAARMRVAGAAEERFGKKVSWGVRHEGRRLMFTHLAVPAMTRLRQPERQVLDTLVAAGVARSRSDALAWCVRQVGDNAETWLGDLRDALRHVQDVRRQGPDGGAA
ncbi:hypothetical protein DN069_19865 [Streptacidiphilus pinicola]|uniref:Uncharacterized protein n=1 Tax=Streptacidiphilus pinicola TaxID=2219663 RepID=A0A2X0K3L2_9ACTN|nr:hypothetical protein [Streptacidiphilus pinicola]RAG83865.1 hypothetical protein DN069_19865 [Streptacidiphilus pinicola]